MEENRLIKFRGYSQEYKRWFYGCLIIDETQKKFYIVDNMTSIAVEVISNTVGQYTGIKDKIGKEIYEKDIVKWGMDLHEVIYVDCCFATRYVKNHNSNYLYDYTLASLSDVNLEVVGNTYNNSNLLEEKNAKSN